MNCSLGEPFVTYIPMKIVVTSQALLSLMALIINPLVFKTIYSKMYFHRNIRILLGMGIIISIFHAAIYVILQGTHSYLMLTANKECDVMVPPTFCNIFRIPAYFSVLFYSIVNNGMVVERLVATIKVKTYEDTSYWLGIGICILSFVLVFIAAAISLKGLPSTDYVPYCSLFNAENARQISWAAFIGIILEGLVVIIFIVIFFVNKWMEKNQRFNVKSRYQVRETLSVCRTLFPWLSFQFTMVLFHATAGYVIPILFNYEVYSMGVRTVLAGTYMMPLFSVISPITLNAIYKREQVKRRTGIINISKPVTSEQYFLAYTAGWNTK